MIGDLPQMQASNYANTAYGLGNLNQAVSTMLPFAGLQQMPLAQQMAQLPLHIATPVNSSSNKQKDASMTTPGRRLVQVVIIDPNENIPLEDCVLHNGDQKLTDLTDQELFFELDVKTMLATHNEKRVKVVDKKVKERTEYLEAAKIRDLKMVVVTVAQF